MKQERKQHFYRIINYCQLIDAIVVVSSPRQDFCASDGLLECRGQGGAADVVQLVIETVENNE